MELEAQVAALDAACNDKRLGASDTTFAQSLVQSFRRYGRLTEKQAFWVGKLVSRANGEERRETAALASFSGVYALFQRAKQHLKFPKIVLLLPNSKGIKLYLSGQRSRFPNTVNVVESSAAGPERQWYGRVGEDGTFAPSRSAAPLMEDLTRVLNRLAAEPEKVAAEYGRLTGHCCFCSLPLSDDRSLAVGYGPVCAKNYGLAWGLKDEPSIEDKVLALPEPEGKPMQRRVRPRLKKEFAA